MRTTRTCPKKAGAGQRPSPAIPFPRSRRSSPRRRRPRVHDRVETLTPLASARKLEISAEVKDKEFPTLVEHVLAKSFERKDVLICWHHEEIPHLTRALGVNLTRSYKWADVYDRVWVLTYLIDGTVSFEDRPQRLLPAIPPLEVSAQFPPPLAGREHAMPMNPPCEAGATRARRCAASGCGGGRDGRGGRLRGRRRRRGGRRVRGRGGC